jgi:hypothetical protein
MAANSLMTIFLAIGGFGFLFLILSFLIGDLFDAIGIDFGADLDTGHDFGVFDSRVISVFLTAFGGFGLIGAYLGYGAAGSSLFGLLGGVVFGMAVFYFGKFLYGQQASSTVLPEDLVGRKAQVIVAIKPNQLGQISCLIGDERVEKLARSLAPDEIAMGETVRISSVGSDVVFVAVDNGEGYSLFAEKS